MKPTEDQVWYTMTRTLNLGNYESVKFDIGESRSIGDRDSDEVYKELRRDINARMSAIVRKLERKK